MIEMMRLLSLLFPLIVFLTQETCARNTTTCGCGWVNKGRIIGGKEAKKNEFPWMAALWADEHSQVACGSTIVTRHHAITAAHCEPYIQKYKIVLLVGGHDIRDTNGATKIGIDKIIVHPDYQTRGELSDDIAVIVTKSPIPFNSNIGPACLPTGPIHLDDQKVLAIGWGKKGYYLDAPPVLQVVDLTVMSDEECRQHWRTLVEPKSQICGFQGVFKGVCQGDSGGPLVWLDSETKRYTLVGVPSYVRYCTFPPPAVFTEVGVYIPWVKKIIQENKPEQICTKT